MCVCVFLLLLPLVFCLCREHDNPNLYFKSVLSARLVLSMLGDFGSLGGDRFVEACRNTKVLSLAPALVTR